MKGAADLLDDLVVPPDRQEVEGPLVMLLEQDGPRFLPHPGRYLVSPQPHTVFLVSREPAVVGLPDIGDERRPHLVDERSGDDEDPSLGTIGHDHSSPQRLRCRPQWSEIRAGAQ